MTLQEELKLWQELADAEDFPVLNIQVWRDPNDRQTAFMCEIEDLLCTFDGIPEKYFQLSLYILKGWAREKLTKNGLRHPRELGTWSYECPPEQMAYCPTSGSCSDCLYHKEFITESHALIAGIKELNNES